MPNMLIVGETNNGKTMIATRFAKLHPAREVEGGEAVHVPVLMIQAPPAPDERRFYMAILDRLFASYRPGVRIASMQAQVIRLLRYAGVQVLVIDEIHHVLAGYLARQRAFLNVIKYLGNELQVPIVALGIHEAARALHTDPQLANRFEPVALPRWVMGEEFLMLLASFETMLPLRERSGLTGRHLADTVLAMSEGLIGEVASVLAAAAVHAVRTGRERIDEAVLLSLDWIPPSQRRRHLERLA